MTTKMTTKTELVAVLDAALALVRACNQHVPYSGGRDTRGLGGAMAIATMAWQDLGLTQAEFDRAQNELGLGGDAEAYMAHADARRRL